MRFHLQKSYDKMYSSCCFEFSSINRHFSNQKCHNDVLKLVLCIVIETELEFSFVKVNMIIVYRNQRRNVK